MKALKEIEVRDMRDKFFMVDDAYFNGYAKKCGDSASLVYMLLCRHASRDQQCFPSITLMSDKLGIKRQRVIRGLKILESWNIIHITRQAGERSIYFLLDKSNWRQELPARYVRTIRKPTKKENAGVEVTWEGNRMRTLTEKLKTDKKKREELNNYPF